MTRDQRRFATEMVTRRKRLGLTQNQAADRGGVSRTLWRQMEDPERAFRPRRANVVSAARLLRWDLNEALTLAGHEDPPTEAEHAAMIVGLRDELDRLWRNLSGPQQEAVVHVVATMARPDVEWSPIVDDGESRPGIWATEASMDAAASEDAAEPDPAHRDGPGTRDG